MDELTLEGKNYLSSKRAAQITGYAKDYVGQLCREGRIEARLVGRNWYVLETSLRAHRFGAEESKEPISKPESHSPAWESPIYSVEPAQLVPELRPKPLEVLENGAHAPPALADMQSAWKEWFASQATEEKMLPDASEMLLEGPTETAPPEQFEAPTAVEEPRDQEESVPIHIERHEESVAAPEEEFSGAAYTAPVAVSRSYVQPTRRGEGRKGLHAGKPRATSQAATRAVLLGFAGIAVAITIIGSGAADRYLESAFNSAFFQVPSFIGGVSKVSK